MEKSRQVDNFDKGKQLKKHLESINDSFDYIIIDCPPSLGVITINALTASNSVIIPVQCEFFALEGITQLLKTIMLAQKQLNPTLDIEGVLLTMLDSRTNLGFEVVEDILTFLRNDLGISSKNIEKCPSILYLSYTYIRSNYEFLKSKDIPIKDINTCLHILVEPKNTIEGTYDYVEKIFGREAIIKNTINQIIRQYTKDEFLEKKCLHSRLISDMLEKPSQKKEKEYCF